jgi:ParB/RepB/Spo0J family partition protein
MNTMTQTSETVACGPRVSELKEVPLADIFIDDYFNCRGNILPYMITDLADNIKQNGLIQPVTLMPYEKDGYKYKLVAGFRRTKAHQHLQLKTVKAVVDYSIDSEFRARLFNLSENLCRKDLNMLQEAKAIEALYTMGLSLSAISSEINMSIGWVQERVYLLELPQVLQEEANAGWLTGQIVRQLYQIKRKSGESKVLEAARAAKERIQRGEKVRIVNKKHSVLRKRRPGPGDITRMQEKIEGIIGPGFATRVLGWVQGALSEYELLCYLSIYADKQYGIVWDPPKVNNDGYIITEEADI